jgi:hypothetical protein
VIVTEREGQAVNISAFEGLAIIQETEPPLEVHVNRPFMFAVMP